MSGNNPPPGPADNRGEIMCRVLKSCLGKFRGQYLPFLGSHGVTTLQHRNSVTEWQTEAPDGPPALLT